MDDAKSKDIVPLPTCNFLFVESHEILASVVEEEEDKVKLGVVIVGLDPNEVRLDEVIPEAREEPVKVLPAAVMVAVPPSEIEVPLIVKELTAHSSPVVVPELALRTYPSVPTTSLANAEEFLVRMSPLVVNVLVPPSGPVGPVGPVGPCGACGSCRTCASCY